MLLDAFGLPRDLADSALRVAHRSHALVLRVDGLQKLVDLADVLLKFVNAHHSRNFFATEISSK